MKKKNLLQTKEMTDLFNTTVDTLRYYEKIGLLHPQRDPKNNYRYYTIEDVRTLGIVMELTKLQFPLSEIKDLLTRHTTQNTLSLLYKEQDCLMKQIDRLQKSLQTIQSRIHFMNHILSETPLHEIQRQYFPARNCIKISDTDIDEETFELTIVEYMRKTKNPIPIVGACDFYTFNINEFEKTDRINVHGVFYYTSEPDYFSNYTLPAGNYLTLAFHSSEGDAADSYPYLHKMIDYIKNNAIPVCPEIYSFYMIDEPESSLKEEYIIELQVREEAPINHHS
ncbi:MAG: MerR family transcriptional regulator [Eubacterium sp.]|nr:MerR family transcriptional regulator [Eubacterium sp.]